jgi:hypothetical protein
LNDSRRFGASVSQLIHFTSPRNQLLSLFDYSTIVIARTIKKVISTYQSQWTNFKSPPKSNKVSRTSAPKTSKSSTSSSSARPRRPRFNPVRLLLHICIHAPQENLRIPRPQCIHPTNTPPQPSTNSTPSASRSASPAACRKALSQEARTLA